MGAHEKHHHHQQGETRPFQYGSMGEALGTPSTQALACCRIKERKWKGQQAGHCPVDAPCLLSEPAKLIHRGDKSQRSGDPHPIVPKGYPKDPHRQQADESKERQPIAQIDIQQ